MATSLREAELRQSTDTDRRTLVAESIAPSESVSQRDTIFTDGNATPRARSPARTLTEDTPQRVQSNTSTIRPYRGFASEAEYLAALHAWAEEKKYVQPDSSLVGFYGQTTVEELASRPRMQFGISKLLKGRKEKKKARQLSAT
jgi:hypothetical protein